MLERLAREKHTSLLGKLKSVLNLQPYLASFPLIEKNVSVFTKNKLVCRDLEPYSQHFIFFVTYEWAK
jgi:hypothetical protein